MKELEANQIIQALNICTNLKTNCSGCPLLYFNEEEMTCENKLLNEAFGLIKSQVKEVARYLNSIRILEADVKNAEANAVKTFANIVMNKIDEGLITHSSDVVDYAIEYLESDTK